LVEEAQGADEGRLGKGLASKLLDFVIDGDLGLNLTLGGDLLRLFGRRTRGVLASSQHYSAS
jgi:hypothetical protein